MKFTSAQRGGGLRELNYPVDIMKFVLTYDGQLLSSANDNRKLLKMQIRRAFHPQLRELIDIHPVLKEQFAIDQKIRAGDLTGVQHFPPLTSGAFEFVPFVNRHFHLLCHLDILFMRREPAGRLFEGNDLDNRIKTLFDALKVPQTTDQIPPNDQPQNDESPFLCLVEDDSLISGFSIRTERLLDSKQSIRDVRLVIEVTVKATLIAIGSSGWLGSLI
jgi:hypothetical protein